MNTCLVVKEWLLRLTGKKWPLVRGPPREEHPGAPWHSDVWELLKGILISSSLAADCECTNLRQQSSDSPWVSVTISTDKEQSEASLLLIFDYFFIIQNQ